MQLREMVAPGSVASSPPPSTSPRLSSRSSTARRSRSPRSSPRAAGAAVGFTLNKYVAFRDRSPITLPQLARFGIVAVATALLMALAMQLVAVKLGVPYLLAKLDLLGAGVRRVDVSRAAPPRVSRAVSPSVCKETAMIALDPIRRPLDHRPRVQRGACGSRRRSSALHAFLSSAAAALRDRRRRRRLEGQHVRIVVIARWRRSRTCASCARRRTAARARRFAAACSRRAARSA